MDKKTGAVEQNNPIRAKVNQSKPMPSEVIKEAPLFEEDMPAPEEDDWGLDFDDIEDERSEINGSISLKANTPQHNLKDLNQMAENQEDPSLFSLTPVRE